MGATEATQKRKVRTSVRFFRPSVKTVARAPKAPKKSVLKSTSALHKYRILRAPVTTEQAMKKLEEGNSLVFSCDIKASKSQIKEAVQSLYEVKVKRVNTLIRGNLKRAYVRLQPDYDALDVANRIGVI